MKQLNIKLYIIPFFLLVMSACGTAFFTEPQPIQAENIYQFPDQMHGQWVIKNDTILISNKYFKSTEYSLFSIKKEEADTASFLIFRNNKVFIIDSENRLSQGFSYTKSKDTIRIWQQEVHEIFLNKNAFLRASDENFILNCKNENQWWELYLINLNRQGDIIVRTINLDTLKKNEENGILYGNSDTCYFDVQWTNKEIANLIQKGVFKDTLYHLEKDKKEQIE